MVDTASAEDLQLVQAIAETGSVGAAARRLIITQPSASQRLARLERRVGLVLFERDTQGARPTPAGLELSRQAEHILGHLAGAFAAARAAGEHSVRRIGTITSLAERVLPVVDDALDPVVVDGVVEHGNRLIDWLDEGTLDAAVLAIAGQVELPRTLRRHRIGTDDLVLLLPPAVPAPRDPRHPLRGRVVVFASYDADVESLRRRLVAAGAEPRSAATVQTAIGIARLRGWAAVVPRSATSGPGKARVVELPWRQRLVLDLVTSRRAEPELVALTTPIRSALSLSRP
jgi:DNA-binding transcriptional LysR family regulator